MSISNYAVCDTETTGFDPATCSLLEVAALHSVHGGYWSYVEFEGKIPPDAKATHHILEEHVRPGAPNCLPREMAVAPLNAGSQNAVLVFHNAEFDLSHLPELKDRPVICTYRCAKHLYPDSPNLKNQTLRYYLEVEPDQQYLEGLNPHRALYDSAVTEAILRHMLKERTLEDLVELTKKPVLLKIVGFGKHKGEEWTKVPRDYLAWMRRSGNFDTDVDLMHTLDVIQGRKAA